jgi:hypothetical protein
MPITAIYLDKRDYNRIQADKFNISDEFIEKFAKETQLDLISEAHYKLIDIENYKNLGPIQPGSFAALTIVVWKFHPFLNIFYNFDYRLKRMTRLALVIIQINIILLGAMGLIFKLSGESDLINPGKGTLFIFIAICAALTLPIPDCL